MAPARHRLLVAVAAALVVLAACRAPTVDGGLERPPAGDAAAVREAREVYGPPAEDVGGRVLALVELVRVARLEPPASAGDGTPAPGREQAVAAIRAAADELAAVLRDGAPEALRDGDGDGRATIEAADDAWEATTRAADAVVAAARSEADRLALLLGAEASMAEVTAGWDARGSRSEQRARFDELVEQARTVVAELEATSEEPDCATALAARLEAAGVVAQRTEQLRAFVDGGQGRAFDDARASYAEDPWHEGLPEGDRRDAACWSSSSELVAAGERVRAGLDALLEALNPPGATAS